MPKQKYWDDNLDAYRGAQLDLESTIALKLIEHWGAVAGKASDKEDSSGRQFITLQEPDELVARAFLVAGLFIAESESRDGIKPLPSLKARMRHHGEAEAAMLEARFPTRKMEPKET